jgi:hypothetical protein
MAIITDPDDLNQGTEVTINTGTKRITLNEAGNLSEDGVTLKALYSFLKEEWKSDPNLIKFPFPMVPITDEQFEFVNGWDLSNDPSRHLIRTAGWAVRNLAGAATQMWAGIISLGALREVDSGLVTIDVNASARTYTRTTGSFLANGFLPGQRVTFSGFTNSGNNGDKVIESVTATVITVVSGAGLVNEAGNGNERANASTQVYYIQEDSTTAPVTNFVKLGRVNQAVQVYRDDDGDGNTNEGSDYDRRGFLKLFAREWGDTYASASLDDIGVTELTYQAYRFPLTTARDIKVQETFEADVANAPYDDLSITWVTGTLFEDWVSGAAYVIGNVVRDTTLGVPRWFRAKTNHSGVATAPNLDGTNWEVYPGEREIGPDSWFAFSVIIDADTGAAGPVKSAEQIYTFVQYSLRQAGDIDAGTGTRHGKIAPQLLGFIGDTLNTRYAVSGAITGGTYIDDFDPQDINRITFRDSQNVERTFPFTATLAINFGANLVADPDASYWVFFTNDDAGDNAGNDYGTANAIIVKDADNIDMQGDVNGQSTIVHTYAYDGNTQRGAGSAGTNAPITAVAIGLSTGQFVVAEGTIARSTSNAVSLVAALERNYSNP